MTGINDRIIQHLLGLRDLLAEAGEADCPLRLDADLRARLAITGNAEWELLSAWIGDSTPNSDVAVCAVLGLTFAVRSEMPMYLASTILREAPPVLMRIPLALFIDHNIEQQVEVDAVTAAQIEQFTQRANYLASKINELGFVDRIEHFLSVWSPIDPLEKRARAAARARLANTNYPGVQEQAGAVR